jgi:hypothetical protein
VCLCTHAEAYGLYATYHCVCISIFLSPCFCCKVEMVDAMAIEEVCTRESLLK